MSVEVLPRRGEAVDRVNVKVYAFLYINDISKALLQVFLEDYSK